MIISGSHTCGISKIRLTHHSRCYQELLHLLECARVLYEKRSEHGEARSKPVYHERTSLLAGEAIEQFHQRHLSLRLRNRPLHERTTLGKPKRCGHARMPLREVVSRNSVSGNLPYPHITIDSCTLAVRRRIYLLSAHSQHRFSAKCYLRIRGLMIPTHSRLVT